MLDLSRIYDAIVVSNRGDANSSGAVKVNIFGITDDFDESSLPWAYPTSAVVNKVPDVGTYVTIRFRQNDFAFIDYMQGTSLGQYLAPSYVESYPDVSVADLGLVHNFNKSTNQFDEMNIATSYSRSVDNQGVTEVTTPSGYSVIDSEQVSTSRVVTEDAVNINTGRPIRQGSQFYKVPTFKRDIIESDGSAGFV